MTARNIPGHDRDQSEQARALFDNLLAGAGGIANGDEVTRRRTLKYLNNRVKVHLDGIPASEKVKLSHKLRERQYGICPRCGLPLPADPDAVEKHRLDRNGGYADAARIELRHRECHRSEHAANDWS